MPKRISAERKRLSESEARIKYWSRWGPYLSERSWGTVREDYSAYGDVWNYFPHDHARARAYRWTEDGILGLCDNHQLLCFSLGLWNGKDPILKERLFGLTGPQGNHGEDVKELYYYLDGTPTASYLKGLYKYPQAAYPYNELVAENGRRSRMEPEFEIADTGVFAENRYFDIFAEYAKNDVDDVLIRVRIVNRGPEAAPLILIPNLWFRNTWVWGAREGPHAKPKIIRKSSGELETSHVEQGSFILQLDGTPQTLFTENESNSERLWGLPSPHQHFKDAFHDYLIEGKGEAINPSGEGTKACAVYHLSLNPGEERSYYFRFARKGSPVLPRSEWLSVFTRRIEEADEFYADLSSGLDGEAPSIQRQAFAGLFWSKQYYHFVVETWLKGDADEPAPPEQRQQGRNRAWRHLFNDDVISMPDKWEYPWYAAWDLAFHAVAIAPADPDFAKSQLSLFLREWYMHPNGQLPAYEWSFSDVNPPVHAWACWRVFQIDRRIKGDPDIKFLESVFHKLLVNFTWWVNRKDSEGANIFEGGFLGLDNIGIFDRSATLPNGWMLEQSDGSSWMAMYCLLMLKIALELSAFNPTYEDIASKFFEHFLYIADAMNHNYRTGLWDEKDGFYYDRLRFPDGNRKLLRVRSLVGIVPLFAADTLEWDLLDSHPGFKKRMEWFVNNRPDLTEGLAPLMESGMESRRLMAIVNRQRLERILERVLNEEEFLSPFGIRSMSRYHKDNPCVVQLDGREFRVDYESGDSQTSMFGGNSNWRGPVWFPMNLLLIEALQRFHHYYGDKFTVEFPAGSGKRENLHEIARLLSQRLISLFVRDENGNRPVYGRNELFQSDPQFRDYILFYEFFNGDSGLGLGASHQTGWTGLVAKLLQQSGAGMTESSYTHPMAFG